MAAASAADILVTTLISLFRPLFTPVDEALSRLLPKVFTASQASIAGGITSSIATAAEGVAVT
ncbi:hypothetical protein ACCO45_003888 [Purpureocillium lilacinum]|uniref:Uncharacterized protein n=1 Tax=Purpureocillium lilacinum TaxID=33203 RepID=A0ACC4E165_PURLI